MSLFQHKFFAALLATAVAVAVGVSGCAGNGEGLNSSGGTGAGGGGGSAPTGPFTADFESIQSNVFTPICVPCHSGANAPHGLMLDATHSYNDLVGVPSVEVPSFMRVKKGDPDNSYIILKLEGSNLISGQQMPLNLTPLLPSVIDVIRQWITNGALPPGSTTPASSVNAMQKLQGLTDSASPAGFYVTQTSPLGGATVEPPVNYIIVAFNHEVDASLVNYTNLIVEQVVPAPANDPDTPAQMAPIPAYTTLADGNPNAIIITPIATLLPGTYRVTARGTGGGALADLNAQVLSADFSFTFNVDASP
jgi:Big-like domain-containing protein